MSSSRTLTRQKVLDIFRNTYLLDINGLTDFDVVTKFFFFNHNLNGFEHCSVIRFPS